MGQQQSSGGGLHHTPTKWSLTECKLRLEMRRGVIRMRAALSVRGYAEGEGRSLIRVTIGLTYIQLQDFNPTKKLQQETGNWAPLLQKQLELSTTRHFHTSQIHYHSETSQGNISNSLAQTTPLSLTNCPQTTALRIKGRDQVRGHA